jgi:hypothetical protein
MSWIVGRKVKRTRTRKVGWTRSRMASRKDGRPMSGKDCRTRSCTVSWIWSRIVGRTTPGHVIAEQLILEGDYDAY